VVGCEPSADGVRLARSSAPELVFHQLGVDDDPSVVGNESFDVAIATEVIEHLARPRSLPRFTKQLLRPGGHFIISTPYHGNAKNLVLALAKKWDAHLNPFLGQRTHQVLVAQDSLATVERSRFPRRSLHWSGQNTFPVEEHDYNCTEARETELQDGGLDG